MKYAEKVKFVRGKLQLSQQALAKELGVSFPTINRWESGRVKPNWLTECKFNNFCVSKGIVFEV